MDMEEKKFLASTRISPNTNNPDVFFQLNSMTNSPGIFSNVI